MGAKKNFPIVHTGHIAALPDKDERIPVIDRATGKISKVLGYLVEAQTLEGLSGSPAFVRDIVRVPQDLPSGFETVSHRLTAEAYGEISLLGIYQGSWDGRPGEILAADRNLNDDKFRVPIGMGIVIPAAKIFEVLDMPKLKKMRKKVIDQKERNRAATTDDGFSAPPASDANPKHREDFNSLLTAAARKPERED